MILKRLNRDRRGAVLLMTTAFIPVLIVICALIVDVAIAYGVKSRIESVAVQAAEAAALELPDAGAAELMALQLAEDLLVSIDTNFSSPQITTVSDGARITVDISVKSNTFFSGIVGVNGLDANAMAIRTR